MIEPEVFVLADEALVRIVGQIRDDQWSMQLPPDFATSQRDHTSTLREVVRGADAAPNRPTDAARSVTSGR